MQITLVLGMHRSGTSVLTRAIQHLGASLGRSLMFPTAYNPKGFFEDVNLVRLNERILRGHGYSWHSPPPVRSTLLENAADGILGHLANRWLAAKRVGNSSLGLKDPRLCVLLPFWKRVLEQASCDIKCVIALRHPLCVAMSLRRRDGLDLNDALQLWLRYTIGALDVLQWAWPSTVVEYELFLSSPEAQLRRMQDSLNLPGSDRADVFVTGFLENMLCHFRSGDIMSDRIDSHASLLYEGLLQAANLPGKLDSCSITRLQALKETLESLFCGTR